MAIAFQALVVCERATRPTQLPKHNRQMRPRRTEIYNAILENGTTNGSRQTNGQMLKTEHEGSEL